MLKQMNFFPHYKKLHLSKESHSIPKRNTNSCHKKISIKNSITSSYDKQRKKRIILDTKFNNNSLSLECPRKELINTIKSFLTDTSTKSNTSNIINLNPNPSLKLIKRKKIHNLILKFDNNSNHKKNKIINENQLLLRRNKTNLKEYLKSNKSHINDNNIFNNSNYFKISFDENDCNKSCHNKYEYESNFNYKNEIEKRIYKIEELNLNIRNITNKIKSKKNEINIINNYFKQVNKQLIKVLYNSKTIKQIQNNLDREIPDIKDEIKEMKNKILFITKENDICNLYSYNNINDMEIMEKEANKIENMNQNLDFEIKKIKKKIALIQSLNTNFKKLLNNKIYY